MSRPIGEPSVPLNQARQAYGTRQLQRRPTLVSPVAEFGASHQEIYLPRVGESPSSYGNMVWVGDAASWGGGYVTRVFPADGDFFEFSFLASPEGSGWGLNFLAYNGPDYGKIDIKVASLGYQLDSRPSGCPVGKIQSDDGSYGDPPDFIAWGGQDFYAAVEGQENLGQYDFFVGGQVGDVLTDISDVGNPCADGSGDDPMTFIPVTDGGPGWYRVKMVVNGKNASSSGYRVRITRASLIRLDDFGTN